MIRFPLVVLLTMAFSAVAATPEPLSPGQLRERAGRPVIIVPPDYPKAAADAKIEAIVDVFGLVRADGSFALKTIEAQPDREDFKAAVREVVEYWGFLPSYGPECRPTSIDNQVRVWFEIKEGRGPVVSVSRARQPDLPPLPDGFKTKLKVASRVEPVYPYSAVRAGIEGAVECYMLVYPDGSVGDVTTAPSRLPVQFATSVKNALAKWKFEPRPGEPAICAYHEVVFRLR